MSISKGTIFLLITVLFLSCSEDKNPLHHEEETEHAEAQGVVLKSDQTELVRYSKGSVSGTLSLTAGQSINIDALFLDQDGHEFVPEGDEFSFDYELGSSGVVEIVYNANSSKWTFRLDAVAAGSTTLIVKILHNDHPDFVSPPIPVVVIPS